MNRAYVGRGQALAEGDEVALIPPVSGGAFRLTEDPIDLAAVVAEVEDERAGATATFVGTVRAQSRGRQVVRLEYEAYEGMAENVMADLAEQLNERYDLCAIAITHRVGVCEIGDASVAIAVSAPHRQDALAACKDAIDTLKEDRAPVEEGGLRGRRGVDREGIVATRLAAGIRKMSRGPSGRRVDVTQWTCATSHHLSCSTARRPG